MSNCSKINLLIIVTLLVIALFPNRLLATETEVQGMMNSISQSNLYNDIYHLQQQLDSNPPYQATSSTGTRRFICSEIDTKAAWIYQQFQDMGLQVEYDVFIVTYTNPSNFTAYYPAKNVVATYPGIGTSADGIYVIGAHYDSTNKLQDSGIHMDDCSSIAPGANDNASGVATVLETARALIGHKFSSTIKFVAFTAEEYFPTAEPNKIAQGSYHYSYMAKARGDNIKGMLSPDMVSFNPGSYNPNGMAIWATSSTADVAFCDKMIVANSSHSAGMTLRKINLYNPQWSDHVNFHSNGFASATNTQDYYGVNGGTTPLQTDFSIYQAYPFYHKFTDTVDRQHFPFFAKYVKLVVAFFSDLATLDDTVPTITSINPSTVTAGTQVTINGSGFGTVQSTSTVIFCNNVSATVTSWNNTQIVCTIPVYISSGNITVNIFAGTSNAFNFSAPQITSLNPNYAAIGTTITITGTDFGVTKGGSSVTFYNNLSASTVTWSNTQISCVVPSNVQSGSMTVTTALGTSNGIYFTLATPQLTSLTTNYAAIGTTVTITGNYFGFTQGSSSVTFYNNQPPTNYSIWCDTQITCVVPANVQSGSMTVTTPGGTSNGLYFTLAAPQITSVDPNYNLTNTTITITGSYFGYNQTNSSITFYNNQTASIIVSWSNTQIICYIPVNTQTGPLTVTTPGGTSNSITYIIPPHITNLNPHYGVESSYITVEGTNFGTNQGTSTVKFYNDKTAAISSWNDTQIICSVPTGAETGNLVVTTIGGYSNSYYFTVSSTTPIPKITNISPTNGKIGDVVTITGENFGFNSAGVYTSVSQNVKFGNIICADIISWSITTIKCKIPSVTIGNTDITVTYIVTSQPKSFNVVNSIRGLVVDSKATSNQLPGAIVELQQNSSVVATSTSNTFGSFRFDNIAIGDYNLVAKLTNYTTNTSTVQIYSALVTPKIELVSLRNIFGYVYDDNNTVISEIPIKINQNNITFSTSTNNSGYYYFGGLSEGTYEIIAEKEGYHPKNDSLTLTGTINYQKDFILKRIVFAEVLHNKIRSGEKAKINFSVQHPNYVTIKIYNTVGELIKTIADNVYYGTENTEDIKEWDGTDNNGLKVPSGIYLLHIRIGNVNQTKKIVFIR